jgi:hypothetical protein
MRKRRAAANSCHIQRWNKEFFAELHEAPLHIFAIYTWNDVRFFAEQGKTRLLNVVEEIGGRDFFTVET